MKSSEWTGSLKPVLTGAAAMLLLSMVLAGILAALMETGRVPVRDLGVPACGITILAALAGAWVCGKGVSKARLPLGLGACGLYLLTVFVLRGLIFYSVGERLWQIPLCAVLGTLAGAMISAGPRKKSPRRR